MFVCLFHAVHMFVSALLYHYERVCLLRMSTYVCISIYAEIGYLPVGLVYDIAYSN
jgi:hypothetical protein